MMLVLICQRQGNLGKTINSFQNNIPCHDNVVFQSDYSINILEYSLLYYNIIKTFLVQ